jgi:hypothetical protein
MSRTELVIYSNLVSDNQIDLTREKENINYHSINIACFHELFIPETSIKKRTTQ